MPKKQKQKQKQSQVTKVSVRIGDTNKPKRRPRSAPAVRQPSSIGITLQGTSLALPPAPTQQYNELVQQMDTLRRQLALSGSLIPKAQTNDILNRVQATNPFSNLSNFVPEAVFKRAEGVPEEVVEGLTTQNYATAQNGSARVPIDQDWIQNVSMAKIGQNLSGLTTDVGVIENVETVQDISFFDDANNRSQRAVEVEYGRPAIHVKGTPLKKKEAAGMYISEMFSEEPFTPQPGKRGRGRPKKG